MDKEWLNHQLNNIDFPEKEVMTAITHGIEKGRRTKKIRKRKIVLKASIFPTAAAIFMLASGFVFSPMTQVLAKVPIIGFIYENVGSSVGKELFKSNLVTEINEKATNNGVDVTITSAYYDGNIIGITFEVNGKNVSIKSGEKSNGPESSYSYYLFNGDEQKQWGTRISSLIKTENGYGGTIEFYSPYYQLPENFSLPLTFTSIGSVNGEWKFDIPVKKAPYEKLAMQAESISKDGQYTLQMNSIIKGKATTLLEYKTIIPKDAKQDEIRISVFNDKGERLSKNSINVIESYEHSGLTETTIRELFNSKINKGSKYLMVYPEIRKYEKDTLKSIENTPFVIKSNRFDYKLIVNDVNLFDNELTINYQIENVNTNQIRLDIVKNFADLIQLIKSNQIKFDKHGELDQEQILKFAIQNKQLQLVDRENLQFQSTFKIENLEEFDMKDFSILVPFRILSLNDPIKMEPIKIKLNN